MLAIPPKAPGNADGFDWEKVLAKYIAREYSPQLADAHRPHFARAAELRKKVVGTESASAEELRTAMIEYYRLLCAMDMRFDSTGMRIQFVWRDAFQQVVKQGESDLRYESTATLFNLAAELSREAAASPGIHGVGQSGDADKLKVTCNLFQTSAGVLELLQSHMSSASWAARSTADLSSAALTMLKTLMLAQARNLDGAQSSAWHGHPSHSPSPAHVPPQRRAPAHLTLPVAARTRTHALPSPRPLCIWQIRRRHGVSRCPSLSLVVPRRRSVASTTAR